MDSPKSYSQHTTASTTTTTMMGAAEFPGHSWEHSSGNNMVQREQEEDENNNKGSSILSATDHIAEQVRMRRKQQQISDYALRHQRVVRDMIRYLYVIIDASRAMRQKSVVSATAVPGSHRLSGSSGGDSINTNHNYHNSTPLQLVIRFLRSTFVPEFYDQNPLSHLGFVMVQHGEAEILSPLSSSCTTAKHQRALDSVLHMVHHPLPLPEFASSSVGGGSGGGDGGEFSLQNGLEVAGRSLGHQPRYGSREILVLTASLSTCDTTRSSSSSSNHHHHHTGGGSLLSHTLPKLQHSRIRVSCLSVMAAEVYVFHKICRDTHGSFGVALDRAHMREWIRNQCVPPPAVVHSSWNKSSRSGRVGGGEGAVEMTCCEMISMGLPTRTTSEVATLVHATHNNNNGVMGSGGLTNPTAATALLARTAYTCPQCQAKHVQLPTDCAVCGLALVLAPHLARSFHHLFPVPAFVESLTSLQVQSRQQQLQAKDGKVEEENNNDNDKNNDSDTGFYCFSCLKPLRVKAPMTVDVNENEDHNSNNNNPNNNNKTTTNNNNNIEQPLLRFQCPDCGKFFCFHCDAYIHESLHNCPGCLCLT